jgi:two-component system OmpR family sensor kinase
MGPGATARPPAEEPAPPDPGRDARGRTWVGLARSTRTRIVSFYVALLFVSAGLAFFAIREVLDLRLDDRVQDDFEQELRELDRLLAIGRDPQTGQPFASLEAVFDVYLSRNVPNDDEGFLALVDGEVHRAALDRLAVDRLPRTVVAEWESLSRSPRGGDVSGQFDSERGEAYYRASPIRFAGDEGAFVVTALPSGERDEIAELQRYGAATTLGVLLVASVFAWLVANRVLAPVRLLTETAGAISQSELTKRVRVDGTDEAAAMARSFNAMLDRLEEVLRSQQQFVQDASHELRNPLTVCRGHLELLGDDPEERRAIMTLVMDELNRMARIVDDLQVLAESEHREFVQREALDAELFMHELVAKAGAIAPRHWQLDQADEGELIADRHRLTQAVMNLAHNAVHHTTIDDTIAMGLALDGDEARLWVRDTGCGISPDEHERIFERFGRGRDARLRYRGSGLGLAIVKAIADAHGGRLEIESAEGEGARFTLVLPRSSGEGENGA